MAQPTPPVPPEELAGASPVVVSTGRLKISFRPNAIKTPAPALAPAPGSATDSEVAGAAKRDFASQRSPTPAAAAVHRAPPSPVDKPASVPVDAISLAHEGLTPEERLKDLQWRAQSLLLQLLAPKAETIEFVPLPAESEGFASLKHNHGDDASKLVPDDENDALLLIAAIRALGRVNAPLALLPQICEPEDAPSAALEQEATDRKASESEAVGSSPRTASLAKDKTFILKLNKEETHLAKAAARSARSAAFASSKKSQDDDDESLALELELEFAQLDPKTRVELLKQIDLADQEQFFQSGSRDERMRRATKNASFHNMQLGCDRVRLGPYYFDPNTRTHLAYHSIAIPEPLCEATALHPNKPELTIINPDLPLPHGFQYYKQSTTDFHPSLLKNLSNNPHVLQGDLPGLSSSTAAVTAAGLNGSTIKVDSSANTTSEGKYRYSVMDGYAQWLKTELESHWTVSAPLAPHDPWSAQFKHQWDKLQPKCAFDYVPPEGAAKHAQTTANATLITHSGPGKPTTVPPSIRTVWKEHKIHLQAEHAVQLAMEGAERALKRFRYGDPGDADIDPAKPLTRDERRKIQRREKEYTKLKQLFIQQNLVDPEEYDLDKLTWYDFHTLFSSLGISVAHLLEEEAAKNQLPAIIIGPNGQVKARSHKKGAARLARLAAAKKAASTSTNDPATTSSTPSNAPAGVDALSRASTPAVTDLDTANPKKRSRSALGNQSSFNAAAMEDDEDDDNDVEVVHFEQRRGREHALHSNPSTGTTRAGPGAKLTCQACGVTDNDDFAQCSNCDHAYHLFCLDNAPSGAGAWLCPSCSP